MTTDELIAILEKFPDTEISISHWCEGRDEELILEISNYVVLFDLENNPKYLKLIAGEETPAS